MAAVTARSPRRLRWYVVVVIAWGLALSGALGVLVTQSVSTAHRADATATDLRDALCPLARVIAESPVQPNSSELGRGLVRQYAAIYQRLCRVGFGPLGPVDPDAYKPASPTPAPTPTR